MQSLPPTHATLGTLDGTGAGDHDQPYVFAPRPRSHATAPFTTRQYLHLLVLRSRVEAGLFAADDLGAALENHSPLPGVVS
jgi:hypothetical protein